jgi:hypothetical protein
MEKLYPQRHGNFVQMRFSLCLSLLNILKKREKENNNHVKITYIYMKLEGRSEG